MKKVKIIALAFIFFLSLIFLISGKPLEREIVNISKDYAFEDPENYLFGEKEETIIIQNQNLDFSFEVSKDWTIEGFKENLASGIVLLSPDYTEDENSFVKEGCKIIVTVYSEKEEYSYLKENIELLEESTSTVKIDDHFAKITGESLRFKNIKVPLDNNIYSFEGYFSETKEEYCKKNYNDLINSISFSK